jgi:hypothetical protein
VIIRSVIKAKFTIPNDIQLYSKRIMFKLACSKGNSVVVVVVVVMVVVAVAVVGGGGEGN